MNGQSMMYPWSVHHAWVYKVATVLLRVAFGIDEMQKPMTKGNSAQWSHLQRTAVCE